MRFCCHTVADWARYVASPEQAELFAACRLLVGEGVVEDGRKIACLFWGKQPDCPFYTPFGEEPRPVDLKPEEVRSLLMGALHRPDLKPPPVSEEEVVLGEARRHFEAAVSLKPLLFRRLLFFLQLISIGLLLWAVLLGPAPPGGPITAHIRHTVLIAASVSILAHTLAAFWLIRRGR